MASGTPPPHCVPLTSTERGNLNRQDGRTKQSIKLVSSESQCQRTQLKTRKRLYNFVSLFLPVEIHAPTPEIPRTEQVGTGARRGHPRCSEDARKAPRHRGRPRQVASLNLAASTPKRTGAEGPAWKVGWSAAAKSIPRTPRAAALAAVSPRPETGNRLATEPPKSKALGLEVPCAAQERTSCGGNPSTSPVPSRRVLHEAASGG